jgi:hypothetical protein
MSSEPVPGPDQVIAEKVQLLSSIFERLWHLDEARPFAKFIEGIDDAIIQHRCRSRIARLHRMLERDYAG